jgi:zinc transport system substrate-binding protein
MLITLLVGCNNTNKKNDKLIVGVSIPPQEAFVQAVGGNYVDIVTIIPKGFSPANYEPSPKELMALENADLYFNIGVPAEKNILPKISMDTEKIIDLQEVVNSNYPLLEVTEDNNHHEHSHDFKDPHIWMSPKRVIVMIKEIEKWLISIDPSNSNYYSENAKKYIDELTSVDNYIKDTLKDNENRNFIIYHPALRYFADDYNLNMLSIEENGKDATISSIKSIIDFALENNIKTIFYQEEFSSNQAEVIAKEINGNVAPIDVLSNDYINNIKYITSNLLEK